MRKVLTVCVIIIYTTSTHAQPPQQQTPTEHAASLKASLLLNDVQTKKITKIFIAQAKSSDSLLKAANGNFDTLKDKMIPLINSTNIKIKAVLTSQQTVIFQKQINAQAERIRQMMQQGMGKGTPPPPQKQ